MSRHTIKIFILLAFLLTPASLFAQEMVVRSPNGKAEVRVRVGKTVSYSIWYNKKTVVTDSAISLSVKGNASIGVNPKVIDKQERKVDQTVTSIVPVKRRQIRDVYNELRLRFEGNYGLVWRVYDNGAAYRWTTDLPGRITIANEQAEINLNSKDTFLFPEETDFYSQNERDYFKYKTKELKTRLASLPVLVNSIAGVKLWISESDLYDYAGMWVQGSGGKGLQAAFPKYPLKEVQETVTDLKVTERADYIAETAGTRQFPWRVFALEESDKGLLDNELVYLLADDTKEDFSWVRPGKVSWDWWNALTLDGVDFKPGLNTATYKYYIDFASKYGLEYIIMDEGWSKNDDPLSINPDINLPELIAYAKQKNVGIILWVVWGTLDRKMDPVLDKFQQWGVSGIKVDFMQRDDQKAVNFYERTARETAKRKLLVDFHGAHKPTGLNRKFPNVLTFEGVKGLEHSKFFQTVTPEHDLTIPFIRMAAGPMDYTPGAMLNSIRKGFAVNEKRPMSQGTRGHQLAMYVIYESPLQMLADSPTNYQKEAVSMEFLSAVPTVWDQTVALDGKVGEYAAMARRADNGDWYIGAMTNWKGRTLDIDLSFLSNGNYEAQIYQDGPNAEKVATDLQKLTQAVKKGDRLRIKMAAGGGYAARLVRK